MKLKNKNNLQKYDYYYDLIFMSVKKKNLKYLKCYYFLINKDHSVWHNKATPLSFHF